MMFGRRLAGCRKTRDRLVKVFEGEDGLVKCVVIMFYD